MAQSRFNRNFELIIGVDATTNITVTPPFRVTFSADKSVAGGLNKINLAVYNLKESNRLKIAKDPEQQKYTPVEFRVGYGDDMRTLFKGSVHKAANVKQGADFITTIEGLDGGHDFINSFTSRTVIGKGVAVSEILKDMPNTARGKIAAQQQLVRPKVLVGSSTKLIADMLDEGQTWFIDNEQLYIIEDDQVVSSFIPVVNSDSGLLTTPTREQSRISFETMMNPALRIGGLMRMDSVTAPQMNGIYRIDTMGYSGDNYGNDWKQSVIALPSNNYRVL